MRNFDLALLEQYRAKQAMRVDLLHLSIDGTDYRYTTADVPVPVNGELYKPRGFSCSNPQGGAGRIVSSWDVMIVNLDRELTIPFAEGGAQGSPCVVSRVFLNSQTRQPIAGAVGVWARGKVGKWSRDEGEINFAILSPLAQWKREVGRVHSPSCSWRVFKGKWCRYTGPETTCDRSYARCSALGNTINFGGHRFLSSIEGVNLWWGPSKAQAGAQ